MVADGGRALREVTRRLVELLGGMHMPQRTCSALRRTSRRPRQTVALVALVGAIVACTSSSSAYRGPVGERSAFRDPKLLTRAELSGPTASSASSLLDALRQVRPLWL